MIDEFHNHHSSIIHNVRHQIENHLLTHYLVHCLMIWKRVVKNPLQQHLILHHPWNLYHHPAYYRCHLMGKEQCLSCCLQLIWLQIREIEICSDSVWWIFLPWCWCNGGHHPRMQSLNDQLQSSHTSHLTDILAMMSVSLVASSAHAIQGCLDLLKQHGALHVYSTMKLAMRCSSFISGTQPMDQTWHLRSFTIYKILENQVCPWHFPHF